MYFCQRLEQYTKKLEREVQLEHTRAMNRIIFDKTVSSKPQTFPFVTLPESEPVTVPSRGAVLCVCVCVCVCVWWCTV